MGANPSLPNIKVNFKSKCCNAEDDCDDEYDGTDLARPESSSRIRKRSKTKECKRKIKKRDIKVVTEPTVVQSEQADEKKISN
jgi:hypothetical protein